MAKHMVNKIPKPKPVNEYANGNDNTPAPMAVFAKFDTAPHSI